MEVVPSPKSQSHPVPLVTVEVKEAVKGGHPPWLFTSKVGTRVGPILMNELSENRFSKPNNAKNQEFAVDKISGVTKFDEGCTFCF